jgi:hypothetical protein
MVTVSGRMRDREREGGAPASPNRIRRRREGAGLLGRPIMKRTTILCAVLAVVLAASQAVRSEQFDSRAFFEQLRLNGVSMSEGFDGEKFFEKLRLQGVSDQKPLDAQAFFEKLRLEGVAVPDGFDARKFFDDLAARGVAGPSMITAPTGGGPTAAECQIGWQPAGKWDLALFNRLCQGRK